MKKRSLQGGGGTSIPDYKITDLATFNNVTSDPHQVAGLYFFSIVDFLVHLAHKVSYDFFKRPEFYTDLQSPKTAIPPLLAELHARYGSSETLPSTEQRYEIYIPIFGWCPGYSSEEAGDFSRLRDDLFRAAARYAERVFDEGVQMLLDRARTTTVPFRQYLIGLQGDSVKWSRQNALPHLTEEVSYTILRNPGITGIFGVDKPAGTDSPYIEDSQLDKTGEAISKQLIWSDKPDEMCWTRELISNLVRNARVGAEAIATGIDFKDTLPDDDLILLIQKAYTWKAAWEAVQMSLSAHAKPAQPTAVEEESRLAMGHTTLYKAL